MADPRTREGLRLTTKEQVGTTAGSGADDGGDAGVSPVDHDGDAVYAWGGDAERCRDGRGAVV